MSLFIASVFTYDEDAGNYIQAVETADTQALEPATRKAINNFVIGCKQDGIWEAIKASCILAGARTLDGALVPLAGPAPSNVGPFVSGDYNRKLGLESNASKWLISNASPSQYTEQNSAHISAYLTSSFAISVMGSLDVTNSRITWMRGDGVVTINSSLTVASTVPSGSGFAGLSRSNSANYTNRINGSNVTVARVSNVPSAVSIAVFGRNINGSVSETGTKRIAFYSIGESLDLSRLDARVTDLINAFAVTIP
jgi:hypothetical protein